MRFNPRARLDTSGLEDRTSSPGRRGGGAGLRIGGIGGLVVLVVLVVVGVDPSVLLDPGASEEPSAQTGPSLAERCRTGADAQADEDCQLAAIVQSLNGFWAGQFEQETGQAYRPARTVSFDGAVTTDGCGSAGSEVGPFYCPVDRQVYLDLSFFSEMLERDLGGRDAGFTRAYVVAHEYGHHVENLLGVLGQVRTGTPLTRAFDEMAARSGLAVVSRFAEGIAIAVERGTPLADVLHAQALDVREASRRALIESGARREVLMMVPVVFLVLPTVVVFAFWPGLVGLSLVVP